MRTKRFISWLLVITLVVSILPGSVFSVSAVEASSNAVISVRDAYTKPGATVNVDVMIENNPGILGMTLKLQFDDDIAALTEVVGGDALSNMTFTPPKGEGLKNGCTLLWDAESVDAENVKDGIIATLTFQIADDAQPDEIMNVSVSAVGEILDADAQPLNVTMVAGQVQILTYTPGDVNDDGQVTSTDVVYLRRYIAGGYGITINEAAGDVNNDGVLTSTDVVYIRRYIVGGYGIILKPSLPKCAHTLQATNAKEPTCTEDGNIAYWYCDSCGKYFSDEEGKNEIHNVIIKATGHTYAEGWVYNQESHWHAAICEHGDLVKDMAAHTYGNDKVCDVCGFDSSYLYKLATPQGVTVKYDVITWTAIPNADRYTIVVNGDYEYVTRSSQCSLTSVKNSDGNTLFADRTGNNKHGEVSIVVYANDNGEYTKSDTSEPVTYYYVPDAGAEQSDKKEQAENYGLGLGYNMVETGFHTGMQPGKAVFDVGKLLAIDQLTTSVLGTGGDSSIYFYTSIDDYIEQKSSSEKANISIGGGLEKLFTAGLKADLSYGSNSSYTSNKYFTSYVSRINKQTGLVNFGGQNSDIRIHCLSQQFLQDIRRESNATKLMSDEQLCEYLYKNYGTHTALGIIKGGYFVTSYSLWTNSVEDLKSANSMFSLAIESKVGTFFDASAGITAQGEHTITTKDETTVSQLISSYYGGSTGVSGDKAAFTDWTLTKGSDDVPLSFTNNGAEDISSLIGLFEQEFGCLGTNDVSLGKVYGQYINDRADDLYHELYDAYTYQPPFDVEVIEEDGKNVLVIDLSMYQADGKLNAAGCGYLVDGIFNVYPNMLGKDIDTVKLIGAMDEINTDKQLLDGFSLALKGKWTQDVEIILENLGVEAKSEFGIVDATAIPKTTNVDIRYEGINIVRDISGIYDCYVEHKDTSCRFVLSDTDFAEWVFSNAGIDGDVIYLPAAIKPHHAFAGWFDGEGNRITDALGKLDTTQQFSANAVVLKTQWNANTYTIQLNNQGAATPGTEKIYLMYGVGFADSEPVNDEFTKLSSITIPTKKGQVFKGYYTRADVDENKVAVPGEVQYIDADGIINNYVGDSVAVNVAFRDNVVLYAKWVPAEYTVEYCADSTSAEGNQLGGSVSSENHSYSDSKSFTPAANGFTCYGKSFACWNTKEDGTGTDYYPGTIYNSLTDIDGAVIKLYAKWTDNIKVTFDAGYAGTHTTALYMKPGGDTFYSDPDCKNVFTLAQFQIPVKIGYALMGYYDSVEANNTPNPTGSKQYFTLEGQKVVLADGVTAKDFSKSSITLYAHWTPITYTISYNANGGSLSGYYTTSYTVESEKIVLPTPTYNTYPEYNHFVGWYLDENCTKLYTADYKTNPRNLTLYAKWDLCTVYNSIDATPWSISGRVIIDWRNESDTDMLNHVSRSVSNSRYNNIDISSSTKEVIFIGNSEQTFANLRMYICEFSDGQKLTIRFVNFNFVSNESTAIGLYADEGVDLTIDVTGSCSIGTTYAAGSILGLPDSAIKNITFTGSGTMSMTAGNGADATTAGGNRSNGGIALFTDYGNDTTTAGSSGSDGGTAIIVDNLTIDMTGRITVTGGDGGNGAAGANGKKGSPSYSGHNDRNATGDGADGGDGTDGGNGGNAGKGGYAYDITTLVMNSGALTATGGNSGNGGNGGNGGAGGKGQESGGWGTTAGDGGDGGDGGNGGDTYIVAASDGTESIVSNGGTILLVDGAAGTAGQAGSGGAAGAKGMHCDSDNCGQWATGGNDGSNGTKGSDGSAGKTINIP